MGRHVHEHQNPHGGPEARRADSRYRQELYTYFVSATASSCLLGGVPGERQHHRVRRTITPPALEPSVEHRCSLVTRAQGALPPAILYCTRCWTKTSLHSRRHQGVHLRERGLGTNTVAAAAAAAAAVLTVGQVVPCFRWRQLKRGEGGAHCLPVATWRARVQLSLSKNCASSITTYKSEQTIMLKNPARQAPKQDRCNM